MGKLLSLGPRLKYPITITKLLKKPGDVIQRKEPILQFSWKWMKKVGDPFGEEWEEEQTTYAEWDSPSDGSIKSWKIQEDMVIQKDQVFVDVEETCSHDIQFAGLCARCGKDMTEVSWASRSDDTERAKINMIHDQNYLTVSQGVASKAEEELQQRLLKHRKLSLVVDLDQTIIHACIEPTVGEWQRDPSSPNYEAVKEVKSFQLNDDGPRGVAQGCWYYIKMRPGLKEFLAKISEMYELHVYTMGTRAYALNIAKIVDPDKKLFGDRIISRDENGNMTAKSLARLFPVDTKMVVIIDDRADVWPKNRPNLIKVHAYDFFTGIGDINSSFLPKREEIPKSSQHKKKTADKEEEKKPDPSEKSEATSGEAPSNEPKILDGERPKEEAKADGARVSALEELVRMGGGDDQALREEQAAEQEKFLEKQLTERPLLHLQEQLDKEEESSEPAGDESNGTTPHEHHRHNLLKDDDVELMYLEQHLSQVHKAFYDEFEGALHNAQGGRVAQLKHGHVKKVSVGKGEVADLKFIPDIADVMPRLKHKVLEGTTIVLSGIVPLSADFMRYLLNPNVSRDWRYALWCEHITKLNPNLIFTRRSEVVLQAGSFGADIQTKISRKITHVIVPESTTRTSKVRQALRYPKIHIVTYQWLADSMSKWARQDETPYLIEIDERDRKHNGPSSVPSSIHDSDESDDETLSEGDESVDILASQESKEEESDTEGVMPEDYDGGQSPIDDLKTFDWGGADDELAEFLGSDSDDDSDASDSSTSSKRSKASNKSSRGQKRNHDEATDEEDSDGGSDTIKRQKTSKSRQTGLRTVKTPNSANSESSLPTPGPTGGETEGEEGEEVAQTKTADGGSDEEDDDLEADLLAEFEKEEQEASVSSDGGG